VRPYGKRLAGGSSVACSDLLLLPVPISIWHGPCLRNDHPCFILSVSLEEACPWKSTPPDKRNFLMIVEGTNLSYTYAGGRGISDVTLAVSRAETVGLVGPNGSGKSTLLKCFAGLLRPTSGRLQLFGQAAPPVPVSIRRRLGVLLDTPAHFAELTGRENAAFFARAYGLSSTEAHGRLEPLFERFGLTDQAHDPANSYSYGMGRKLALVEALAHNPDLILLDEPGVGLDYTARVALAETLRDRAAQGAAILLATNDVTEAEQLCNRMAFLHQGRLIACDTPAALLARLRHTQEITLQLTAPVDLAPLRTLPDVAAVSADAEATVHVLSRNGTANIAGVVEAVAAAGGQIRALNVQAPNLGDVFLLLTGHRVDESQGAGSVET